MSGPALRTLVILTIAQAALLVFGASQHIATGPPYERATLWLALVFAGSGSLIGLLTLGTILAPGHWSSRVALASTGAAVFAGGWTLFAEWNDFLIWQMIVIGLTEAALLVIVLAIARRRGARFELPGPLETSRSPARVSVKDLLVLTAAAALLASVVGSMRPVGLSASLIGILIAGGLCAALVVLAGCWTVAGQQALWTRALIAALVAPIGGAVYAICSRFERLLLSAPWYALVTTLLLGIVIGSLMYLRSQGIEITWARSHASR